MKPVADVETESTGSKLYTYKVYIGRVAIIVGQTIKSEAINPYYLQLYAYIR